MKTASFFTELKDLSRIDWPLLNSRNFRRNDENDPGRTDRYQAEALIWRHLPIEALLGIVSCNEDVNSWLQTEARRFNRQVDIRVHEGWYF
jgi:hypothetical protein